MAVLIDGSAAVQLGDALRNRDLPTFVDRDLVGNIAAAHGSQRRAKQNDSNGVLRSRGFLFRRSAFERLIILSRHDSQLLALKPGEGCRQWRYRGNLFRIGRTARDAGRKGRYSNWENRFCHIGSLYRLVSAAEFPKKQPCKTRATPTRRAANNTKAGWVHEPTLTTMPGGGPLRPPEAGPRDIACGATPAGRVACESPASFSSRSSTAEPAAHNGQCPGSNPGVTTTRSRNRASEVTGHSWLATPPKGVSSLNFSGRFACQPARFLEGAQ